MSRGSLTPLHSFAVPETYAPTLLRRRAARLTKITGRRYCAPMDLDSKQDLAWFRTQLVRPWQLLFQEPIVFVISVYMAIVYVSCLSLATQQLLKPWSFLAGNLVLIVCSISHREYLTQKADAPSLSHGIRISRSSSKVEAGVRASVALRSWECSLECSLVYFGPCSSRNHNTLGLRKCTMAIRRQKLDCHHRSLGALP